ncbi:hypothetical protein [Streptomyces sp. NBC_00344]|uniref:hypothetical protein n=1 Tax=Streptomyces sp. NBC_00344 TaxID=2975720 RepID=UPI002E244BC1
MLPGAGDGGAALCPAPAGLGAGRSCLSPTLGSAPGGASRRGAADASRLLMTVTQLGGLLGVAATGTLFANRLDSPAVHASGHALPVCAVVLAAAAKIGGAGRLVRRGR